MQANHPPKTLVRSYLRKRSREKSPPPTPEQIRRELGWHLVPGNGPVPEVPK